LGAKLKQIVKHHFLGHPLLAFKFMKNIINQSVISKYI